MMSKLRKPMLHPAFQEALVEGLQLHAGNAKAVRSMANIIAETMEDLHGGEWRVEIDHMRGFVLIAPNFKAEARP
jgi:hypothetical protein